MTVPEFLLLAWSVLSFWELGQIWLAQTVIYPLFAEVGSGDYVAYHRSYARRIPFPVIVPGFASFLLPIPLAFLGLPAPAWMMIANILAGLVGLLVTICLEIPRHARLEANGKDTVIIGELIRYNWPRTASVTTQAIITFVMLSHAFASS